MIACELGGVEIDQCLDCRGIWLDAGELEMLTELAGVEPGGLTVALGTAAHIRRTKRRCPRCNRKMQLISLARPLAARDQGRRDEGTKGDFVGQGDPPKAERPAAQNACQETRNSGMTDVGRPVPVELDRCPIGHGLWFDHGELQAVIANFHEGEEGTVAEFFADLLGNESKPNTEGGV